MCVLGAFAISILVSIAGGWLEEPWVAAVGVSCLRRTSGFVIRLRLLKMCRYGRVGGRLNRYVRV